METEKIEALLEQAFHAEPSQRIRILNKLADFPKETLRIAFKILQGTNRQLWQIAIQVIRTIGYPRNTEAALWMIARVEDKNYLAWEEAVQTLLEMGPNVVVPYLILEMLDAGRHQYWGEDLEGICIMLSMNTVEQEYAKQCGPALVSLASRYDLFSPEEFGREYALDVLEKIGPECATYALPMLIHLIRTEGDSNTCQQARHLIATFDQRIKEPYKLILASLEIEQNC